LKVMNLFHFEMKVISKTSIPICPACKIDEFQLATMIRILKTRNRELYDIFNKFYDDVVEKGR
jgi:hypothetical protein